MSSSADSVRPASPGPAADELEVSLFGPGYGECVVMHVGYNDWLVIDSCVEGRSGRSVALGYLEALGVAPATAVRLIVASHWHDDHIRGLAQLVEASPSAEFACSAALLTREFMMLTETTRTDLMMTSSGVDEFRQVLGNLDGRSAQPLFVVGERVLYRRENPIEVEVQSLTPSDQAFVVALNEMRRLLPAPLQPKRRIWPVGPNHSSVVIWVRVGSLSILLGADLQEEPGSYWTAVLASNTRPTDKAKVFKIPHHGASNADHPDVWRDLVEADAVALLTPFRRGNAILPSPEDQERICANEARTYITAKAARPGTRRRERTVERTIKEVVKWIGPANGPMGQVRARRKIDDVSSGWAVETFGPAHEMCA